MIIERKQSQGRIDLFRRWVHQNGPEGSHIWSGCGKLILQLIQPSNGLFWNGCHIKTAHCYRWDHGTYQFDGCAMGFQITAGKSFFKPIQSHIREKSINHGFQNALASIVLEQNEFQFPHKKIDCLGCFFRHFNVRRSISGLALTDLLSRLYWQMRSWVIAKKHLWNGWGPMPDCKSSSNGWREKTVSSCRISWNNPILLSQRYLFDRHIRKKRHSLHLALQDIDRLSMTEFVFSIFSIERRFH